MVLNKASWDAAFTSIGARLRAREALEASFEDLIATGVGLAIAEVQSEIGPWAAQAHTYADQIEAIFGSLSANGVPADSVITSSARRFTSDTEMALKGSAASVAALAAAVALLAPLASPALTGTPTAPTAPPGTNTTQIATTAFVAAALAALVNAAPAALDTLNELATALGDDPNFATTVATALSNRLRVDAAQTLDAGQKAQAASNLGLGALAAQNAVTDAQLPIGAWVTLATLTASDSAELAHTSVFSDAYDEYEIALEHIKPVIDGVNMRAELYQSGAYQTAAYLASAYKSGDAVSNRTTYIDLTMDNTARLKNSGGCYLNGLLRLNRGDDNNLPRMFGETAYADYSGSGQSALVSISATHTIYGPLTGIRFYLTSGNINSGKIHIRGRKK